MSQVVRLPTAPRSAGDTGREVDVRLVRGLRGHEPWAAAVLVDRYIIHLRRVLTRVLGAGEPELDDLVQEVFTRALAGAHRLSFEGALSSWLTSIAVFTGRETIRRRSRWRWLWFTTDPPERPAPQVSYGRVLSLAPHPGEVTTSLSDAWAMRSAVGLLMAL